MVPVTAGDASPHATGIAGLHLPSNRRRLNGSFAVSVLVFALAWEVIAQGFDLFFLPPVSTVLASLWELVLDGTLLGELIVSLTALIGGLLGATVVGVSLGTLMGMSPRVKFVVDPYVSALMSAPMTPFVPLFIIIFGLSYTTRIVSVFVFAVLPILVNTLTGVERPRSDLLEMAFSFGASPGQLFWRVRLPMAYPMIAAGLRLGTARGVDGLITGEVLIAAVGLGGLVSRFGSAFTAAQLWAVVLFIVVLALLLTKATELMGKRLMG